MSFRLKTIIGIALIEAALLLLMIWSAISYLTESNDRELALRARVTAESMVNLIGDAILSSDLALLDSVAKRTLDSPEIVYVRILDADQVLAQAGDPIALAMPFQQDDSLTSVEDGIFDARAEIHEGGYVYGGVELGLSTARSGLLIAEARKELMALAFAEMALVALFSSMLGIYLTRGLNQLSEGARKISRGELGYQIPVSGQDELAQTGQAFNSMSERLAKSQEVMQESIAKSHTLAKQLSEKEVRLSTILNTAVDGIITIDARGLIESINRAGAQLFGYDKQELLAQNVSLLMPEPYRGAHDGNLKRYLQTNEPHIIGSGRAVYGLHKNGDIFPIDLAISEIILDGKHLFVGLVRDMTEQREAEAAARRSDAMRAAIIDANLDALVTVDAQDRIIEFSSVAEQTFGYRRDQVLGRSMGDTLIPPEMRAAHRQGLTRYREDKQGPIIGQRIEVEAMHASGIRVPVELTVHAIEVEGETLFTAMIRDITERKQQEQTLLSAKKEAEVASEAKSRFLAHMSHEIRSPLNAVLGSIGLLLDDQLSKQQRVYAKTAESSGKSLLGLINDILDFSKIEAGAVTLDISRFDLHELLDETMDMIALRAREKRIPIAASIDPRLNTCIDGDRARLRQIFSNLLDNALKFTEAGAITLTVTPASMAEGGPCVRFSVQDTGIGIPEAAQETLFDEFQQVDNSDSTRFGGTGLGLSIVRGFVDLMSGSLSLHSRPGEGTRFDIEIPLPSRPGRTSAVLKTPMVQQGRLLAFGFHPLIEDTLTRMGSSLGCEIHNVNATAELEGKLASGTWDTLLVCGLVGEETMKSVAGLIARHHIRRPILMMAGEDESMLRYVTDGTFADMLLMPLRIEPLLEVLSSTTSSIETTPRVTTASSESTIEHRGHLLLAEDSAANQLVATALLQRNGFTVDTAWNGREAVECFRQGDYDLILMDLRMPEVDGLQATAQIRALPGGGTIPIVALTANAQQQDVDRCLAAGMVDFIPKPVDKIRMLETLSRHLQEPKTSPAESDETLASSQVRPDSGSASGSAPLIDDAAIERLEDDVTAEAVPAMMEMFVVEARKRAEICVQAIAESAMEAVEDEAHTLKSCAGTFGAARLHALSREMEGACRAGDHATAAAMKDMLEAVLEETVEAYRTRFDNIP